MLEKTSEVIEHLKSLFVEYDALDAHEQIVFRSEAYRTHGVFATSLFKGEEPVVEQYLDLLRADNERPLRWVIESDMGKTFHVSAADAARSNRLLWKLFGELGEKREFEAREDTKDLDSWLKLGKVLPDNHPIKAGQVLSVDGWEWSVPHGPDTVSDLREMGYIYVGTIVRELR